MRCRFCHKKVAGRPKLCPHCGFYTGAGPSPEWDSVTGKRTQLGWVRLALIALCLAAVFAGYALRETGSAVTINGLRYRAYASVTAGLQALMGGEYAVAADHLRLALREEPAFPEAHLALALTQLGLSNTDKAIQHSVLAAQLAELGMLDRLGALKLGDGTKAGVITLSRHIECVAHELRSPLSNADARWLLSVFGDLTQPSRCREGVQALRDNPRSAPSRVLQRAVADCPERFACLPK